MEKGRSLGAAIGAVPVTEPDLAWLYRRYRTDIYRYIARTFGMGPPDPDDVVQIVFEKYAHRDDHIDIANAKRFLIRSAHNYVIDQRRRFSVRDRHRQAEQDVGLERDDIHAERVYESKERWEKIEVAIASMRTDMQEMLIWSRIHGLSSAEIARRKGCSATWVKTQIAQALVICKRALDESDKA